MDLEHDLGIAMAATSAPWLLRCPRAVLRNEAGTETREEDYETGL